MENTLQHTTLRLLSRTLEERSPHLWEEAMYGDEFDRRPPLSRLALRNSAHATLTDDRFAYVVERDCSPEMDMVTYILIAPDKKERWVEQVFITPSDGYGLWTFRDGALTMVYSPSVCFIEPHDDEAGVLRLVRMVRTMKWNPWGWTHDWTVSARCA